MPRQLKQASTQLRLKLLGIIVCLLMPLFLFQALEFYQVRTTRTRITQERAFELAKAAAARFQDVIDDSRSTLETLAWISELAEGRNWSCTKTLEAMAKARPWVRHIGISEDRRVVCSTNPKSIGFDLSRRDWFIAAEKEGGFSVSDFLISEVTQAPSTFAAYIPSQSRRAYMINLDLAWLDRLAETVAENRDIAIVAVDSRGVTLARYPKPIIPGHAKLPASLMGKLEGKSGLFESPDLDGRTRFFGAFHLAGTRAHILVGFDKEAALGLIDRYILIAAVLFIAISIVGAYFVWTIGDRIFVQPIGQLNRLLRTTLDTMDQGLIAVDKWGRAVVVNRQACRMLDLPTEFSSTKPHQSEILAYQKQNGEFDSDSQFETISAAIEIRAAGAYERRRPNGTVLEIRTVPADGGLVRTYTDITARRQAEEAIKRERDKATAAARAASEFLANMSHELRTPLTAILTLAEILKDNPDSNERSRHLDLQQAAARNLLGIINDVLDFSKLESGGVHLETIRFSLFELLQDCVALISSRAASKGIPIVLKVHNDVSLWVEGDPLRLQQILVNLLANAVKFTSEGQVALEVTKAADHQITFSVTDTGIGIARDDLSGLFERFRQVDSSTTRKFGGSGLGLAISQAIAKLMGGRIRVASALGEGSIFTFTIDLPACREQLPERPTDLIETRRLNLLLVEDNEINRDVLKQMLESRGHVVVAADGGRSAIQEALRQPFHAILMDVRMPEVDGYEAARAIRSGSALNRNTPIFALTADVVSGNAREIDDFSGFIAKPVDWAALDVVLLGLAQPAQTEEELNWVLGTTPVLNAAAFDELRASIGPINLIRLLSLFVVDANQRFADQNAATLSDEAHSFGGSAGLLGFSALSEACCELVTAIASRGDVAAAFNNCINHRERAISHAETLIAELHAESSRKLNAV